MFKNNLSNIRQIDAEVMNKRYARRQMEACMLDDASMRKGSFRFYLWSFHRTRIHVNEAGQRHG